MQLASNALNQEVKEMSYKAKSSPQPGSDLPVIQPLLCSPERLPGISTQTEASHQCPCRIRASAAALQLCCCCCCTVSYKVDHKVLFLHQLLVPESSGLYSTAVCKPLECYQDCCQPDLWGFLSWKQFCFIEEWNNKKLSLVKLGNMHLGKLV